MRAYRHRPPPSFGSCPTEPLAIVYGAVEGLAEVPLRVHDACFTSEVLGSMKVRARARGLGREMRKRKKRPAPRILFPAARRHVALRLGRQKPASCRSFSQCDCAGQLNVALKYIREQGPGLVIYLHQEVRACLLLSPI